MAEKINDEKTMTFHGWLDKPFSLPEYFKGKSPVREQETIKFKNHEVEFKTIKQAVINYFKNKYDNNKNPEEQNRWIDLKHGAVIGKPTAVEWFKREIEDFLIRHNWLNCEFPFPHAYGNIVEAVYQETFGIGPVSTWWKHPRYAESEAALIIGRRVFFEFPGQSSDLQEVYYESEADVERIAIQLSLRSPTGILNKHNPSLEIDMEDGTRVTISIPPLTVQPQIIFRHFTKPRPTLTELAQLGTFPYEFVPVLEAFAAGRLTTIFCGPVRSGKSTTMKAFIGMRNANDNILVFHKEFDELRLHEMLPQHKIMQYLINEENMNRTFPLALRSDYEYIVVAELRSFEAEVFLKSTERGRPGALTTFHTMEPDNIPALLADLIIEAFPSKSYESQYRRAAKEVHLAIVQEEMEDRSKKCVKVSLFDWQGDIETFRTVDILRWDHVNKRWVYNNYIPERLLRIMRKYAPYQTQRAIEVLNHLVNRQEAELSKV